MDYLSWVRHGVVVGANSACQIEWTGNQPFSSRLTVSHRTSQVYSFPLVDVVEVNDIWDRCRYEPVLQARELRNTLSSSYAWVP